MGVAGVGLGYLATVTATGSDSRRHITEEYLTQEGIDLRSGAAPTPTEDARRSGDAGLPWAPGRRYGKWIVPAGITASYVLFTVAVHLRLLDKLDVTVRDAARPGEVWGPVQVRAARVVGALQPAHLAFTLLLVVAVLGLRRRSLRPFWATAVVGSPVVLVTFGTMYAMVHWDPSTAPVAHGSFPSGHMVTAVTVAGVVVLLFRPGTQWGWMLPAAMGCVMGSALVLASVHPATDVIGAGLLATAAITAATAATIGQWVSDWASRRSNDDLGNTRGD